MGACSSEAKEVRNIGNAQTTVKYNHNDEVDKRNSVVSSKVGSHYNERRIMGESLANGVVRNYVHEGHGTKPATRGSDAAFKSSARAPLESKVWDPIIGEFVYILEDGVSIDGLELIPSRHYGH